MDLALHLGTTASALRRDMPESELHDWVRYDARRGLPLRRIELYLAQIALYVAQGRTDRLLNLSQFMFKPRDHDAEAKQPQPDYDDLTVEDVAAQFGGRVYRKKKG